MKCQNLRTQEVVAVKVVKNRTAYFNQSMMEVSVLDLVCSGPVRSACVLAYDSNIAQQQVRQE